MKFLKNSLLIVLFAMMVIIPVAGALEDKIGVYKDGSWYLDWSGNGVYNAGEAYSFGSPGWLSVVGDWNGDGKTKIGISNGISWYLDYNGNGIWDAGIDKFYTFGATGWTPVLGDWNHDGKTKIGVYQNGVWYLDYDGSGGWNTGDKAYSFGSAGWTSVLGDWDGNGKTKIGVYQNGVWYLDYDGSGGWNTGDKAYSFGSAGWTSVLGDWNGNGKTKIGVYQNGVWYLDYDGSGGWNTGDKSYSFGSAGWTSVLGDWDGNGKTKIGVYQNGAWYLDYNGNGAWNAGIDKLYTFGATGWTPLVGKWTATPVTGCDYPAGPYIDFTIYNVNYPGCTPPGAWQPAACYDNALIRYALAAGDSISYYDTLLPWMWKRNLNCPDPGYSFAVANPYNKAIYIAGVKNTDTGWYHAVDAEHLIVGNPSYSVWQDWKFFNYDNLDIKIGNYQIPAGTAVCRTKVWIRSVDSVFDCGAYDGMIWKTFYIDSNKNIFLSQNLQCPESNTLNQTGKSLSKSQDETAELKKALQLMDNYGRFAISKWEFDQINEKMIFYTYDIRDKRAINDLQGTLVDNYTIQMIHDTEFETTRADVQKQLIEFRNNPEYKIGGISMVTDAFGDPAGNYAELWVYDLTPENKKIDNTVIKGWTILVYPLSMI